jgi:hypothetical protein
MRRESQSLERSAALRNLRNELFSIQRIEQSVRDNKWKSSEDLERLAWLPKLKTLADAIEEFAGRITRLEDETMRALYGLATIEHGDTAKQIGTALEDWKELLKTLYTYPFKKPDAITLALFSEDRARLFQMAHAYFLFAMRRNGKVSLCQFTAKLDDRKEKSRKKPARETVPIERTSIEKPSEYLSRPREEAFGLALGLEFPRAFPILELERGLHTFVAEKKLSPCLVIASDAAFDAYAPPAEYLRASAFGPQEKRRNYNLDQALIDDHLLDQREPWHGYVTVDLLDELIEKSFDAKVRALLD